MTKLLIIPCLIYGYLWTFLFLKYAHSEGIKSKDRRQK